MGGIGSGMKKAVDRNYIAVCNKGSSLYHKQISAPCPYFKANDSYIIKFDEDKIMFFNPPFEWVGKTFKATPKKGSVSFGLQAEIPVGRFELNEDESTEDCAVFYFK